ncbi:hypothetical protein [Actinomadura flavalba]|uniref:hypothetical protein n=1 Tax=Actinomadura flavalba TaxID=1120938 RepID=UPI0012DEAFD2|nr:hypothetical protein [Actinomadura flavalba]
MDAPCRRSLRRGMDGRQLLGREPSRRGADGRGGPRQGAAGAWTGASSSAASRADRAWTEVESPAGGAAGAWTGVNDRQIRLALVRTRQQPVVIVQERQILWA